MKLAEIKKLTPVTSASINMDITLYDVEGEPLLVMSSSSSESSIVLFNKTYYLDDVEVPVTTASEYIELYKAIDVEYTMSDGDSCIMADGELFHSKDFDSRTNGWLTGLNSFSHNQESELGYISINGIQGQLLDLTVAENRLSYYTQLVDSMDDFGTKRAKELAAQDEGQEIPDVE